METLRRDLRRSRSCGEVVVWTAAHAHRNDPAQAVRDWLAAPPAPLIGTSHADFVFEARGESVDGGLAHLDAIDREAAHQLLAYVIQFDLAYREECTDAATAAGLADRIVASLPMTARWWTNGRFFDNGWTGTNLTDATFDTGVIGATTDRILVVWFMDED